jgi:hypothetical protein
LWLVLTLRERETREVFVRSLLTQGRLRGALAMGVVLLVGCAPASAPLPPTHPVEGTLTWDDGQPVAGGVILFRSTSDPSVTMSGEVSPEGKYVLYTVRDAQRQPGSIPGEHAVTVMPRVADAQLPLVIALDEPVTVTAGANTIDLQLPAQQRPPAAAP